MYLQTKPLRMRRKWGNDMETRALLLVATVAAGVVAIGSPAYADPNYDFTGGCRIAAITDGATVGQSGWTGLAEVAVTAVDASGIPAAVQVTAECHVYRNGTFSEVVAAAAGVGTAADAREWSFRADPDDLFTLCSVVTVATEEHTRCGDASARMMLSDVFALYRDDLIDPFEFWELIEGLLGVPNNFICFVTPTVSSGVPGLPGALDVTPEGDVYAAGRHYDCPPFED